MIIANPLYDTAFKQLARKLMADKMPIPEIAEQLTGLSVEEIDKLKGF